jgi:hypothetical protein
MEISIMEQQLVEAEVYFMRIILHDYADTMGNKILAEFAAAMSLESRV